jgi:hypothetical protein
MTAAARPIGVAINWRITLLGLNLAAWLVAALVVAAVFMHRDISGQPALYPGFGYSIPMFDDMSLLYPLKVDREPVVDLSRIGKLGRRPPARQASAVPALGPRTDAGLAQHSQRRLVSPEDPGALQDALQPIGH